VQKTNRVPDQNRKGNLAKHENQLPTLRCLCGAEILVVPDLKALSQAIENHLSEHVKTSVSKDKAVAIGVLEQYLIEQVLTVASKTKPATADPKTLGEQRKLSHS
jgi:hypothetical protein